VAALDNREDPRERGTGKKAEQAKQEGKRHVRGADTGYQQKDDARAEPSYYPGQTDPDCSADASQPLLHYYLAVRWDLRARAGGTSSDARVLYAAK
jgi:hypothetical protein